MMHKKINAKYVRKQAAAKKVALATYPLVLETPNLTHILKDATNDFKPVKAGTEICDCCKGSHSADYYTVVNVNIVHSMGETIYLCTDHVKQLQKYIAGKKPAKKKTTEPPPYFKGGKECQFYYTAIVKESHQSICDCAYCDELITHKISSPVYDDKFICDQHAEQFKSWFASHPNPMLPEKNQTFTANVPTSPELLDCYSHISLLDFDKRDLYTGEFKHICACKNCGVKATHTIGSTKHPLKFRFCKTHAHQLTSYLEYYKITEQYQKDLIAKPDKQELQVVTAIEIESTTRKINLKALRD